MTLSLHIIVILPPTTLDISLPRHYVLTMFSYYEIIITYYAVTLEWTLRQ